MEISLGFGRIKLWRPSETRIWKSVHGTFWAGTGRATPLRRSRVIEKYDLDITGVQEVRRPGTGNIKINKSVVFYSGTNQNTHQFGVGFVIKENILGNVLAFEPINERICYLRTRGKFYNISLFTWGQDPPRVVESKSK